MDSSKKFHKKSSKNGQELLTPSDDSIKSSIKRSNQDVSDSTQNFTDLFWHLANPSPDVRYQAVESLVETLVKCESSKSSKQTSTKKAQTFSKVSSETDYTLCRLIKGLLSSRDAARQGFGSALAAILQFVVVDLNEVALYLLKEGLNAHSNSDVPTKDRHLAFIVGFGALVKSGKISETLNSSKSGSFASTLTVILKEMISPVFSKQIPLLEVISFILNDFMCQISPELWNSHVENILSETLSISISDLQPEWIAIAFTAIKKFSFNFSKSYKDSWHPNEGYFGPNNILSLRNALHVAVRTVPRLHSVWDILIDYLLEHEKENFGNFCKHILQYFYESPNSDIRFMIFSVIIVLLPRLSPEQISATLSPSLINVLGQIIIRKRSPLKAIVRQILDTLIEISKNNQQVGLQILNIISGPYGDLNIFDHFHKPALVVSLLKTLEPSILKQHCIHLMNEFYNTIIPNDLIPDNEKRSARHRREEDLFGSGSDDDSDSDSDSGSGSDSDSDNERDTIKKSDLLNEINMDSELLYRTDGSLNSNTWISGRRRAIMHHLANFSNHLPIDSEESHQLFDSIFKFLYFHSYYESNVPYHVEGDKATPSKKKSSATSTIIFPIAAFNPACIKQTREQARGALIRFLDGLLRSTESKMSEEKSTLHAEKILRKGTRTRSSTSTILKWVEPIMQFDKMILKTKTNSLVNLEEDDEDTKTSIENLEAALQSVEKSTKALSTRIAKSEIDTEKNALETLQALILLVSLHSRSNPEEFSSLLSDLTELSGNIFTGKAKKSKPVKKSQSNIMDESSEPLPMDVIVEIIMSLMVKPSHVLQLVLEELWVSLLPHLDQGSLSILSDAIVSDIPNEESEDLSDSELLGEDDILSGSESHDESEKSDESENESSSNETLNKNNKSNSSTEELTIKKLKSVLESTGSMPDSDESSEDINFDDEKMFALDEGLASVVREIHNEREAARKRKNNQMTKEERSVAEFKTRLLHLLDIYLFLMPRSPHMILFAVPLLQFHEQFCKLESHSVLRTRIRASVSRLTQSKVPHNMDMTNVEEAYLILNQLYNSLQNKTTFEQTSVAISLIVFIQHVITHAFDGLPWIKSDYHPTLTLENFEPVHIQRPFNDFVKFYLSLSNSAITAHGLRFVMFKQILDGNKPLSPYLISSSLQEVFINVQNSGTTRASLFAQLLSAITSEFLSHADEDMVRKMISNIVEIFKTISSDNKANAQSQLAVSNGIIEAYKSSIKVFSEEKAKNMWNSIDLASCLEKLKLNGTNHPTLRLIQLLKTGKLVGKTSKYESKEAKLAAKMERRQQRKEKLKLKSTKTN